MRYISASFLKLVQSHERRKRAAGRVAKRRQVRTPALLSQTAVYPLTAAEAAATSPVAAVSYAPIEPPPEPPPPPEIEPEPKPAPKPEEQPPPAAPAPTIEE